MIHGHKSRTFTKETICLTAQKFLELFGSLFHWHNYFMSKKHLQYVLHLSKRLVNRLVCIAEVSSIDSMKAQWQSFRVHHG